MKNFVLAIIALILVLTVSSVFVISEGQRGIVFQFSKITRDVDTGDMKVYEPGLHLKFPFINTVRRIDARIQTLDEAADRFVTSEKKDLMVDSYVKWRIVDTEKFYISTGGAMSSANLRLAQNNQAQHESKNGLKLKQEKLSIFS